MPGIDDVQHWNDAGARERADDEFKDRALFIGKARGYYDGQFPKQLQDDKDNVVLNLCRQVIDETAAFISPDMPAIELDKMAGVTDANEDIIYKVWMDSGGARLVNQMAVSGGIAGHVFARVVIRHDLSVRIVVLNPSTIIRWWWASDHTVTLGYELRWREGKTEYRTDVVRVDGGWLIREYHRQINPNDEGGTWLPVGDEALWDYPIAPIVDWQHLPSMGGGYGANEIPHADMNLHINKIASDIKSILRYHAFPTTVGTGFKAEEVVETRIDGFVTIANAEAKIYNVEMDSDLRSSMEMLNTMRDAFFNQARVVVVKGGLDTFRGMTNLGIRAAFMPMIAKTAQIRRAYADGLVALSRLLLMLAGQSVDDVMDVPIEVIWGEALPLDTREELALIQQQMMMGVMSKRTAAGRLGLDYDKELSNMRAEAVHEDGLINGIGEHVG